MPPDSSLDGRAAVITGASAGIGRETARVMAREGAHVVLAARRGDRLESIADDLEAEYGAETLVVPTDVTDDGRVDALIESAVDAFGGLDVVVANAATGRSNPIEEMTTEQYRTMMTVNCDGMFFTARAAIPHLRDSTGNLIFVGSFAGEYARPSNPVYAATKWWTRGFALSLAAQVGGDDIAVTTVNPSEVRTEWGAAEGTPSKERYDEGEVTEPETIAEAIAFAARQTPPDTAQEIDLFRRDKFAHF